MLWNAKQARLCGVRSLGTTVALGSGSLTCGGEEAETAWHARGQALLDLAQLPCP